MAAGQWFSSSYAQTVMNDRPKGYWRLGEKTGSTAADSSGYGVTGTYQNTPTLGATGGLPNDTDTAATFTAASLQSVTMANPLTTTASFTLECWVKLSSTNQIGQFMQIGDGAGGYGFGIGNGVGGGVGAKLEALFSSVAWVDSGSSFSDTNYHHVVMVRSAPTTTFYIDAVASPNTFTTQPLAPATTSALGRRPDAAEPDYLGGSLDECAVYDYALPAARITAHKNAA